MVSIGSRLLDRSRRTERAAPRDVVALPYAFFEACVRERHRDALGQLPAVTLATLYSTVIAMLSEQPRGGAESPPRPKRTSDCVECGAGFLVHDQREGTRACDACGYVADTVRDGFSFQEAKLPAPRARGARRRATFRPPRGIASRASGGAPRGKLGDALRDMEHWSVHFAVPESRLDDCRHRCERHAALHVNAQTIAIASLVCELVGRVDARLVEESMRASKPLPSLAPAATAPFRCGACGAACFTAKCARHHCPARPSATATRSA